MFSLFPLVHRLSASNYTPALSMATWGAAFGERPFAQLHQLSRSDAERAHLLPDSLVSANDQQASPTFG
jgi:hypothetical protein